MTLVHELTEWLNRCDFPDIYFGEKSAILRDRDMVEWPVPVGFTCQECAEMFTADENGLVDRVPSHFGQPSFVHFECFMWDHVMSFDFVKALVSCIDGPAIKLPADETVRADAIVVVDYLDACDVRVGTSAQ